MAWDSSYLAAHLAQAIGCKDEAPHRMPPYHNRHTGISEPDFTGRNWAEIDMESGPSDTTSWRIDDRDRWWHRHSSYRGCVPFRSQNWHGAGLCPEGVTGSKARHMINSFSASLLLLSAILDGIPLVNLVHVGVEEWPWHHTARRPEVMSDSLPAPRGR